MFIRIFILIVSITVGRPNGGWHHLYFNFPKPVIVLTGNVLEAEYRTNTICKNNDQKKVRSLIEFQCSETTFDLMVSLINLCGKVIDFVNI